MRAIILIGSTKQKPEEVGQLPLARIYSTEDEDYMVLDNSVIMKAIVESISKLKAGQSSVIPIEIEVLSISERERRRATPRRRKRCDPAESTIRKGTHTEQGNARGRRTHTKQENIGGEKE